MKPSELYGIRHVDKFLNVLNVNMRPFIVNVCGKCMAYRRLHDYRHKKHMQLMLRQDRHFSAFHIVKGWYISCT